MSCRPDPIPTTYCVPGDRVFTPGLGHIFVITSYPVCRLYYAPGAKYEFQPNVFEYKPDKQPHETNHLSYLAVLLGGTMETYITVNDYFKVHK